MDSNWLVNVNDREPQEPTAMTRPDTANYRGDWPVSSEKYLLLEISRKTRRSGYVFRMGAFFLHELDEKLGKLGLFSIRFMDYIVVLSSSRW